MPRARDFSTYFVSQSSTTFNLQKVKSWREFATKTLNADS